jgi:3-oxoacyl-[acyl-carrier protein] reductase
MDQKIALVTGASRGIGAAIAARLAHDGFRVYGTATSAAGAEAISHALGEQGQGLVMDVTDSAGVDAALKKVEESTDVSPTVLVNNAGVTRDNLLMRMKEQEWADVMDTNVTGLYRVTKGVLRGMLKARWGRIVNVGSVVARMGNPGQSNYVASKSAIEGFSRALAFEVASRNITVNTVAPGFVATDMTNELTEDQTAAMLARIPVGRIGLPSEIAAAVAYLVSEEAAYVTGQTLHVNGGLYAA